MAYSEILADRIRKALVHLEDVREKKMFGSLAFLVDGKMCVTAGSGRMMVRINPDLYKQEIKREGCDTVIMRGREYKGFIYVMEENLKREENFKHWINLALDFNRELTLKENKNY